MYTKRRRICLWMLIGVGIVFIALSAVACAEHTGHDCASPADCLLCRLIEHLVRAPFAALSTAVLPGLQSPVLLCAFAALLSCRPFFSLIFLHVQMND